MGHCQFLRDLFEDGRVTVPDYAPLADEVVRAGDELIAKYEQVYRLEMPGTAPRFVVAAGCWAGTQFFHACQFAVYRDVGAETLNDELNMPFGEPFSGDVHYSVDLVFRYLPELAKFAVSAAEHDPLLGHLDRWATEWPLSSVGMSGIEDVAIDGFVDNSSLMQLYADRIIATGDMSRLRCDAVRQVMRRALGMYPELDRGISTALSEHDERNSIL
jgi:hypothetical protein